jgi:hypothetical protein
MSSENFMPFAQKLCALCGKRKGGSKGKTQEARQFLFSIVSTVGFNF